jgi:hypothetical protein
MGSQETVRLCPDPPDAAISFCVAVLESNHGFHVGGHCWLVHQCDRTPRKQVRNTMLELQVSNSRGWLTRSFCLIKIK